MKLTYVLTMSAFLCIEGFAQQPPTPAAHWDGAIHTDEKEMRLAVDLAKNAKGEWIGSITIPDAGVTDVPLKKVAVEGASLKFALGFGNDSFDGKLSADGAAITGTAASDKGSASFQLERGGEAQVKLAPSSTVLSAAFEGAWQGTLDVSGQKLRAILQLKRGAGGIGEGTLVSVDQGNQQFPITTVIQKDKEIRFGIQLIRARYVGTLSASGAEIEGEYTVDGLALPLVFRR